MRETLSSSPVTGTGVVVWGATGQAKVLRPIIESRGFHVAYLYDRDPAVPAPFPDIPMTADLGQLLAWIDQDRAAIGGYAIAIGGARGRDRLVAAGVLSGAGLAAVTLVHERAWIARSASLGEGCQVLAMAAISEEARLGRQCIVNTKASVDHECLLSDGVHIMPGATLAGCVEVGEGATVGSGATVLPRLRIGAGAMVGAGAVVTTDVRPGTVVMGVPARPQTVAEQEIERLSI